MKIENLPALPADRTWNVRDFQGNEIQWYRAGERLEVRVLKQVTFLGLRFKVKDYDYPTLLCDPLGGEAELLATAAEIMQKHAERMQRLANGSQLKV